MKKILRWIFRKVKYYILTKKAKFILNKYGIPKVKDSLETINVILTNRNKTVTRFGDGEFNIIKGENIKFQEHDDKLSQRLIEILRNNDDNIITCIPAIYDFNIICKLKYKSQIFWLDYIIKNHKENMKYIDSKKQYYDACFSRPYIRYNKENNYISEEIFKKIKEVWNERDILIVEGEFSRLGVGNDLFSNARSIKRLLCPSKNAFRKYDEILSSIIKHSNDKLVIISLGPTATVLAYDLAKNNIKSVDLGHIDLEYEWFLNKVNERIAIKNKSVNELAQNFVIENLNDDNYNNSIVEKII